MPVSISRDGGTMLACGAILAAAALSIFVAPSSYGLLGAALAILMGAIAVSDLRHFTIPDAASAPALALGLVYSVIREPAAIVETVMLAALRALILAALFLAMREIYRRWRGRVGIGLGDVKLAGVAGAWLDWSTIPLAIEVAALAALAAYAFVRIRSGRPMSAMNRVPFGLFLAPAIWLGWLYETAVLDKW